MIIKARGDFRPLQVFYLLGDEVAITLDYSLAEGLTLQLQTGWFLPKEGMYESTATSTPGDTVSEYLAFIGWEF